MPIWLSVILRVCAVLGVIYLALWWFEWANLYLPTGQLTALPRQVGLPYEDIWIRTQDGRRINAWWIPAESASPTILLCHGNAGNLSDRLDKAGRLHRLGLNVFVFDYGGYGRSEGRPSEKKTYADGEAAYQYLVETRRLPPEQVILQGESLGGAIATELAVRHSARALILESAFTSTVAMANRLLPWLPARWLVHNRYDNLAKIPDVRCPVLVLHSSQDDVIPYAMGQALFKAAREPKQFVTLIGDHNEGYIDSGDRYTHGIAQFLRSIPATGHPDSLASAKS